MSFSGTKGYITKPKPGVQINPLRPLSRGLVGYWLFNEGSGNQAYDISGHGNHGRLTNMSPNIQGSGWGGSKFGGGLKLDGVNDYVDCGNNASMCPTSAISISAWINTSDFADTRYIISCDDIGASKGYSFRTYTSGAINILFQVPGLTYKAAYGTMNSGQWTHVVGVYNGSHVILYIDGIANIGDAVSGNITYNSHLTHIGKRNDASTHHFNGSIDSVCIYNRALSATEVKQLYHDPFCNLLQVPLRRYSVAAPPIGAIMNQFQRANIGADLYNGVFA